MISRSVNPRVSLNTAHTGSVHTWEQNGRCTVQDRTSTGRAGYTGGSSEADKMPYLNGCTSEKRHMTGGGTPAVNGAPNTAHRTTNTEDNTMNDNDRPERYQEGVDRHDDYELAFCTGHGYSVIVENGAVEVNTRFVNPECN